MFIKTAGNNKKTSDLLPVFSQEICVGKPWWGGISMVFRLFFFHCQIWIMHLKKGWLYRMARGLSKNPIPQIWWQNITSPRHNTMPWILVMYVLSCPMFSIWIPDICPTEIRIRSLVNSMACWSPITASSRSDQPQMALCPKDPTVSPTRSPIFNLKKKLIVHDLPVGPTKSENMRFQVASHFFVNF